MYPCLHILGSKVTSLTLFWKTLLRSSSAISTSNGFELDRYIPGPITLALTPAGNCAVIPANIVSAVTAVSASNGVGAGRISPSPALDNVALTGVVSISVTLTSMYA
jgi:hypothetical protein